MRRVFGVLAVAVALSGCSEEPAFKVTDPVVRLAATPNGPAVAYFTMRGGPTDDRLLDVTSPNAIRAELHESMRGGGTASMKPLTGGVALPANTEVKFEPGGKHVMLFDVNPETVKKRTVPLLFVFASGARYTSNAAVKRAGVE